MNNMAIKRTALLFKNLCTISMRFSIATSDYLTNLRKFYDNARFSFGIQSSSPVQLPCTSFCGNTQQYSISFYELTSWCNRF